jgi:hypothetical protein
VLTMSDDLKTAIDQLANSLQPTKRCGPSSDCSLGRRRIRFGDSVNAALSPRYKWM